MLILHPKQLLHSVEGKLPKATMLASWLILLLPGLVTSHSEKHMIGKTLENVLLFAIKQFQDVVCLIGDQQETYATKEITMP